MDYILLAFNLQFRLLQYKTKVIFVPVTEKINWFLSIFSYLYCSLNFLYYIDINLLMQEKLNKIGKREIIVEMSDYSDEENTIYFSLGVMSLSDYLEI